MSEKLTTITLPGSRWNGIMDWGEHDAETMIESAKKTAQYELEVAQAILNADSAEFQIDLVRGSIVQHHIRTIQSAGRRENATPPGY